MASATFSAFACVDGSLAVFEGGSLVAHVEFECDPPAAIVAVAPIPHQAVAGIASPPTALFLVSFADGTATLVQCRALPPPAAAAAEAASAEPAARRRAVAVAVTSRLALREPLLAAAGVALAIPSTAEAAPPAAPPLAEVTIVLAGGTPSGRLLRVAAVLPCTRRGLVALDGTTPAALAAALENGAVLHVAPSSAPIPPPPAALAVDVLEAGPLAAAAAVAAHP
jgi:hypothetical protein